MFFNLNTVGVAPQRGSLTILYTSLTSLGLDQPEFVWRCIAGPQFHVRFAAHTVHIWELKRRYVAAEYLLQFSDNPPPGSSPPLHLHQSAQNQTPPWSVQGQPLNPVGPSSLALQLKQKISNQLKVTSVSKTSPEILNSCEFHRPSLDQWRSHNLQNKCKLPDILISSVCSSTADMELHWCSHTEENSKT